MALITILWLRRALRLADNPALAWACARAADGGAVIPIYIDSPDEDGDWPAGAAGRWWLHHSLGALRDTLEAAGSRLVLRPGPCGQQLRELIEATGADAVCWDRGYEPAAVERDKAIKSDLCRDGIVVKSFNTSLLFEPWDVRTAEGNPYQVFTPFWKTCMQRPAPVKPLPAPKSLPAPRRWPSSLGLDELGLLPGIDWAGGLREAWEPGEAGAVKALEKFRNSALCDYPDGRDRPDKPGTSRLSPHLHFGEVSPRRVWHTLAPGNKSGVTEHDRQSVWAFLREVGWREFAHHLLYHFPHTTSEPLRPQFKHFPWRNDAEALKAWQTGNTGYPIVDAGMRQLWRTGWMHNRVRMIAASFLVKDLLLPWRDGAAWFRDTLVDADLANNTLGWQWTAGCGADAAPYFRVFNPTLQGRKFDPDGDYVRRWVPELKKLDTRHIHEPSKAPADALKKAGVELGKDYPRPIVDHGRARDRALAALDTIRKYK